MKRAFITLITFIVFFASFAADKPTETRLKQIEESVIQISQDQHVLEGEQDILYKKTVAIDELIAQSTSAISSEIAASDRLMGILTMVLSIVAVFLGLYVAWMQQRMRKMSDTVQSMTEEVEKKKNEVSELVDMINTNFDTLYERIRRADTRAYVKRLEQVPLDDMNIGDLLLARDLEDEDYVALKNAYMKVIEIGKENYRPRFTGPSHGECYRLLFFQHFLGRAIEDDAIRDRVVDDFDRLVQCCFDNDIKKSLSAIAPVLSRRNVPYDRVIVLRKLLEALDKSEFKDNKQLYDILQNGIADEDLWSAARATISPQQ